MMENILFLLGLAVAVWIGVMAARVTDPVKFKAGAHAIASRVFGIAAILAVWAVVMFILNKVSP